MTEVIRSREQLSLALPHDRTRAVVMTMGALHAGHAALIDAAREDVGEDGHVTVTIFVNPLQFGPGEDFDAYPRDAAADIALCREHGADAVFLPSVADVYRSDSGADPGGITIDPGRLGQGMEGDQRPGHFSGMLTVVLALLHLTQADRAYFGEKDFQQLTLVRAMARRFYLPVRIIGVPTVREPDGLAMSSRNVYLTPAEREQAAAIPAALSEAQEAADAGADADAVVQVARDHLAGAGLHPDYVELRDPMLGPAPEWGEARLLVAVPVGRARLLDNVPVLLREVA